MRPGAPLPAAGAVLAILALCSACDERREELIVVGTVERTVVELAAPTAEVIVEVSARRGQHVAPGTLLVRLDSTLAEAEVARAEAARASARTSDRVALRKLQRLEELRSGRVASEQDLELAQLERDEAAARLREAHARLAATQKRAADLILTAPVAGVVDQLPFEAGERVPAGAVLVVLLADGDPWVRVWVPEHGVALLAPGTPAKVRIDGVADILSGRVLDVAREPSFTPHYALTERDRAHLVYETRVTIQHAPAQLRPGVPAEVTLSTPVIGPAER